MMTVLCYLLQNESGRQIRNAVGRAVSARSCAAVTHVKQSGSFVTNRCTQFICHVICVKI